MPKTFFPDDAPIADWVAIDQLDVDSDGEKTSLEDIINELNLLAGFSGITRADIFRAARVDDVGATGADGDQARLNALNNAREGDGLDRNDVLVIPENSAVLPSVVAIGSTSVTITSTSVGGNFALVYFGSELDMVEVTVKSTSHQKGITLELEETGLNTGVFDGTFTLASSTTEGDQACSSNCELQAANGDVITVSYKDASEDVSRTKSLSVELGAPEVSNLGPASGTHTNDTTVVLTGDLVDAQSGVNAKKIRFYLYVVGDDPVEVRNKDKSDSDDFSNDEYNLNAITGGVQASVEVTLKPDTGVDTVYRWYLTGEDNAGNPGASEADSDVEGTGDANPHSLTYDKQPIALANPDNDDLNAILGQSWDPTKKNDPDTDKDERLIENVNTSIIVNFNGAVDGTSVEAGDFTVDGGAVDAADWFSGKKDSVFLTVAAKGPSATPKVEVASGGIRDAAGNANSTALTVKAARDGLAPKLTVEVSGDDTEGVPVSDSRITITVTANETLGTNPTISYRRRDGERRWRSRIDRLSVTC